MSAVAHRGTCGPSRRDVLIALFGAQSLMIGESGIALNRTVVSNGGFDFNSLRNALQEIFGDTGVVSTIGRRYLDNSAKPIGWHEIAADLFGPAWTRFPGDLRTRLLARRDYDFQNGDIVVLDGWIVARSEVLVCALATLVFDRHVA